jgi:pyruvate kinase
LDRVVKFCPLTVIEKDGNPLAMKLPSNKTKIICTIGPACDTQDMLEKMISQGMDVARLNLSHGDFIHHAEVVQNVRAAADKIGKRISIMADLPGPKIRTGILESEPVELEVDDHLTLTSRPVIGRKSEVSVSFERLAQVVRQGDTLFLCDGEIELEVEKTNEQDVNCRVLVGGELRSRKGINIPGVDLGMKAFTDHDMDCLRFAAAHDLDAVSQSFVESDRDMADLRRAAAGIGYDPFFIAKIERSRALEDIDGILQESDGVMIARGDLGVEIPIEEIAIVQKNLMRKAHSLCKPVITATQMLESMIQNRRPTRAEATDVANAILDGTDCVMLSGESAMGKYPLESTRMLKRIAEATEPHLAACRQSKFTFDEGSACRSPNIPDLITLGVNTILNNVPAAAVFVPTRSGATARRLVRFRLPLWIVAVSSQKKTCQGLVFSYGCFPVQEVDHPEDWNSYVRNWLRVHEVPGSLALLTEGPSSKHPETNNRLEIIDLERII